MQSANKAPAAAAIVDVQLVASDGSVIEETFICSRFCNCELAQKVNCKYPLHTIGHFSWKR